MDDKGNLLYIFPDLQRTGGQSQVPHSNEACLHCHLSSQQGHMSCFEQLRPDLLYDLLMSCTIWVGVVQARGIVERLLTKDQWKQTAADDGQKTGTIALVRFYHPLNGSSCLCWCES